VNYNPAAPVSRTFTIANSAAGRVDGDDLRPRTGGRADLDVDANAPGPAGLKGTFTYDPPDRRGRRLESRRITSFGIDADGDSATIAGIAEDGRSFLIYVEDNSRRVRPTLDIFKLWIDGVLQTGDGTLQSGNIRITERSRR
jgi:hypothetical protein